LVTWRLGTARVECGPIGRQHPETERFRRKRPHSCILLLNLYRWVYRFVPKTIHLFWHCGISVFFCIPVNPLREPPHIRGVLVLARTCVLASHKSWDPLCSQSRPTPSRTRTLPPLRVAPSPSRPARVRVARKCAPSQPGGVGVAVFGPRGPPLNPPYQQTEVEEHAPINEYVLRCGAQVRAGDTSRTRTPFPRDATEKKSPRPPPSGVIVRDFVHRGRCTKSVLRADSGVPRTPKSVTLDHHFGTPADPPGPDKNGHRADPENGVENGTAREELQKTRRKGQDTGHSNSTVPWAVGG
jgi:hypothetical protein